MFLSACIFFFVKMRKNKILLEDTNNHALRIKQVLQIIHLKGNDSYSFS